MICYHWSFIYIYIYAFSRHFYPKRLTLHSSYSFTFYQLLLSLGIEPMILALLAPCSTFELQESFISTFISTTHCLMMNAFILDGEGTRKNHSNIYNYYSKLWLGSYTFASRYTFGNFMHCLQMNPCISNTMLYFLI